MTTASNVNKQSGGMINYALYIVLAIAIVLIFLSWIMPWKDLFEFFLFLNIKEFNRSFNYEKNFI